MTYDDWKARDDTPEPEPRSWCEECQHAEDNCGCACCCEPDDGTLGRAANDYWTGR